MPKPGVPVSVPFVAMLGALIIFDGVTQLTQSKRNLFEATLAREVPFIGVIESNKSYGGQMCCPHSEWLLWMLWTNNVGFIW